MKQSKAKFVEEEDGYYKPIRVGRFWNSKDLANEIFNPNCSQLHPF